MHACVQCASTLDGTAASNKECHNMRLRMRQHARLVLGTSYIEGEGGIGWSGGQGMVVV